MIMVLASLAPVATNVILTRSPADPGCQVSEVHRLLGTVIAIAVLGGIVGRPAVGAATSTRHLTGAAR